MLHVFHLATLLAFGDIERVADSLCSLPGAHGIEAAPGSSVLQVHFDESRIALEGIAEATARAGYVDARRARAAAGCCGGCCA